MRVLEALLHDIRYALRTLRRQRAFAATAVLTVAVGVGANVALFSVIRSVLLTSQPYDDADRIVTINEQWPSLQGGRPVSMQNYRDWAQQNTVFERIAAVSWGSVTIGNGRQSAYVNGSLVSPSYFDVFQLRAALGRTFAPDEDQPGRDRVVILSHRLWSTEFDADPAVVGRTVRLDGDNYVVIGVMPPRTSIEFLDPQLWRPLTFEVPPPRGSRVLRQAVARLKPGVTLAAARSEMTVIANQLARAYPESNKGFGVIVERISPPVGLDVETSLYLLFAAVGTVLLIACVNLATIATARGTARAGEVAIRTAIGAGRGRLVRQFLTEHVVLGVIGGLCGTALAYVLVRGLIGLVPTSGLRAAFPPDTPIGIDRVVWVFALGVSVLSGLAFGLAPALSATAGSLAAVIRGASSTSASPDRRHVTLRRGLVIAQLALAFVLVSSASLVVRGFITLSQRVAAGFDSTHVLTAGLPTPLARFDSAATLNAHYDEIARRVASQPGVIDVGFSDSLPTQGAPYLTRFQRVGQPVVPFMTRPIAGFKVVSPSYFHSVGLRLLEGRTLDDDDRSQAPYVVVINEAFARTYLSGTDPVGQRLVMRLIPIEAASSGAGPARRITEMPEVTWTIVGVIANEGVDPFDARIPEPAVYATREQHPRRNLALVVRTAADPELMREPVRRAIASFDPDQALPDLKPLAQLITEDVALDRLRSLLLSALAAIALAIAATGLYGLIAFTVAQRTREIGIRLALGASAQHVRTLMVREMVLLVAVGTAIGLATAMIVGKGLSAFLYGINATDPTALMAVAATLVATSLAACYLPTRRATRIDPAVTLRS
jgi:putative ABC transport system permease protein